MTYNRRQLIRASTDAHNISERLIIACWLKGDNRFYHIEEALKSFEDLAETLGYDIKKQEVGDLVEAKK